MGPHGVQIWGGSRDSIVFGTEFFSTGVRTCCIVCAVTHILSYMSSSTRTGFPKHLRNLLASLGRSQRLRQLLSFLCDSKSYPRQRDSCCSLFSMGMGGLLPHTIIVLNPWEALRRLSSPWDRGPQVESRGPSTRAKNVCSCSE